MRSGFEVATGDYFIKFDDDDALTPDFLAKTVSILDQNPDIAFVCTNHWIIDKYSQRVESATAQNSDRWGKSKLAAGIIPDLLWQTYVYQSLQVGSTLFRRDRLQEVDFMRPEADGCEDFDLLVRLALKGNSGYFLPEYLMEYRFHEGQRSVAQGIHFLKAKAFCVASYTFDDPKLEAMRQRRLGDIWQSLGLRLLEVGETKQGRDYLQKSVVLVGRSRRAQLGLLLSYLPLALRQVIFRQFRQFRPKDYTEKVRAAS
jgi:cellulose synthase/poly-beta-1,6-N-acetylglucosamine synthase-like glycosyltransferase